VLLRSPYVGRGLNQSREATQAELLLSLASARFVGQQTVGIARLRRKLAGPDRPSAPLGPCHLKPARGRLWGPLGPFGGKSHPGPS
jgi:hypothetical protein